MKKGAILLIGTKDFSTFRASSCIANSPIRTLEKIIIKKSKDQIEITFVSKSFLQQQVRSMVGCLKFLGEEKWTIKKFREVLVSKKRENCAPPAPACGLYLHEVKY
jgi:tRNA pseudouridine38-40 synthase